MKKRILALCVAAAILIGASSCGNTNGGSNTPGNSDDQAETVTFTFYTHGVETAKNTPKYQKEVLDKINEKLKKDLGFTVDVKIVAYSDDLFAEKVMLDLTSKKSFDFARFTQPTSQLTDLYGKHMILDITDYVNKAENLKKNIPEDVWREVMVDGKIVAIPLPAFQTTTTGWTRGDLLDEAGISPITTLDEFESFLKYIKSKNPDMVPYMTTLANMESYLLGCFTETPGDYVDDSGNIKPKIFNPGYKNFIAKLAEWYKLGLIDDSTFNTDEPKTIDVFGKGLAGVAGVNIWQQQYGTLGPVTEAHPDWKISFLSPLTDAKKYPSGGLATEFLVVQATSKNAEKAIQFADWCLYNEENYRLVTSGIEGKTYELTTENGYEVIKTPESEGDVALVDLYQSIFVGYNGEYNNKYSSPGVPSESVRAYLECSSIDLDKVYVPITTYYALDIPNNIHMARADADSVASEKIQFMIQGRLSMSEWDKMLAEYEELGGLEEYQLYTDEMNKKQ